MKDGIKVPATLLDVHTIPGMSGSPVFGEYTGIWNPDGSSITELIGSSVIGTSRIFLGCYSSRVPRLEERSGLGICHPEKCDRGNLPHQVQGAAVSEKWYRIH